MANLSILTEEISRNVGLLIPPKEHLKRVDYSIASTAVRIKDDKTLDLGVYVKAVSKDTYSSIESLWADVFVDIYKDGPSWRKAKKLLEMLHTVTCNDRTITPEGNETRPRAAVIDNLQALINYHSALPSAIPQIKRYCGRTDPMAGDFDRRMSNEMKFLSENREALNSMIFSKKEQLDKIYAHHAKFAEEFFYSTDLRGIKDE